MIELYAFDQQYENSHLLDISDAGSISLNYEVGKIGDLVGRNSPYSQSFQLPFTATNNKFFRQYYNINVDTSAALTSPLSTFNPDYVTNCTIRVNGIPVIRGTLQLLKCSIEAEAYEIVVLGTEADLFRKIGDKKLIDAFKNSSGSINTDYNVNINDSNIVDSWDITNDVTIGGVGVGVITFPLMDFGNVGDYNFLYLENNAQWDYGLQEAQFLQPEDLKPSMKLGKLFELCLSQAGYTMSTNAFLTSDAWNKLYMTLGSDRESVAITTIHQSQVANTASATILNWGMVAGTNGAWQDILFPTQTGAGTDTNPPNLYDVNDDWDTAGEFIAPFDGTYYGVLTCTFDSGPASIAQGAEIKLSVDGFLGSGQAATLTQNLEGNDGGGALLTTITMPFSSGWTPAGTSLTIRARVSCEAGYSVDLKSAGTFCTMLSTASVAGVADIPANMPDLSQKDFLTDIIQRFNLVVVADQDSPTVLTILPWNDYINSASAERKDWTQKLDLSQKRTITPTTDYKKQWIKFSDLEDEDLLNVAAQNTYGEPFGKYTQKIKGDLLEGELTNDSVFSPFHVARVPRQDNTNITDAPDLAIHPSYTYGTEGPLSSCNPKLFYHNGLKTLGTGLSVYVGQEQSTTYPLCLPYYNNGGQMADDSPLLYWQFQTPNTFGSNIYGTTPSSEGYFKRYWQKFLMSYYDKQARVLDCHMYLTEADIYNFKFNDEIVIEETAYRVLKIAGYQPHTNVPSKVQLLKKINKVGSLQVVVTESDCEAAPALFFPNGTVTFENIYTGASETSEECCNEYDYFWDGTNCLWNYGGGGGGSGDPTVGLGGWNPQGTVNKDPVGGVADTKGVSGFHSRKKKGVPNVNPVLGEHSIRGNNIESFSTSVNKSFIYYATTQHSTAKIATPNGLDGEKSGLMIPYNTMARFTVRALSVQTHVLTGGSGSFGSSMYNVWTALVKNVEGTITVVGISEQTDFREYDADAGVRTIDIVGTAGKAGFAGNRGVNIECTGPAKSTLAWHLDVNATYVDIGSAKNLENLIMTESLDYLTTENNYNLEQE